jgi:hypothetical protein
MWTAYVIIAWVVFVLLMRGAVIRESRRIAREEIAKALKERGL